MTMNKSFIFESLRYLWVNLGLNSTLVLIWPDEYNSLDANNMQTVLFSLNMYL